MKYAVLSFVFVQQPYCVSENFRAELNTRRGFCDNSPSVKHQAQCHGTVASITHLNWAGLSDRHCDESLSETPNQLGSSSRGMIFFAENVLQMCSGP